MTEPRISDLPQHLQDKIMPVTECGCWVWIGGKSLCGYGRVKVQGSRIAKPTHRVIYELFNGKIPKGLEPDHICNLRCCVNPNHIEPKTHAENMARNAHARKTHCKRGHEFTPENTGHYKGSRHCRKCDVLAHQKRSLEAKSDPVMF